MKNFFKFSILHLLLAGNAFSLVVNTTKFDVKLKVLRDGIEIFSDKIPSKSRSDRDSKENQLMFQPKDKIEIVADTTYLVRASGCRINELSAAEDLTIRITTSAFYQFLIEIGLLSGYSAITCKVEYDP